MYCPGSYHFNQYPEKCFISEAVILFCPGKCAVSSVLDNNLEKICSPRIYSAETLENCKIKISFKRKKNKNISLKSENSFDI